MLPMLPFLAGIAVGALAVSTARSGRVGNSLHQAGDRVREAARTGSNQIQAMAKPSKAFTQRVWDAATHAPTDTPADTATGTAPDAPSAPSAPATSPKRRKSTTLRASAAQPQQGQAKRPAARRTAKKTAP